MFGGLKRFITAEVDRVVAHVAKPLADVANELRTLTAAVVRLESRLEDFVANWEWPNEKHTMGPGPLPPQGDEHETPPARPRRKS